MPQPPAPAPIAAQRVDQFSAVLTGEFKPKGLPLDLFLTDKIRAQITQEKGDLLAISLDKDVKIKNRWRWDWLEEKTEKGTPHGTWCKKLATAGIKVDLGDNPTAYDVYKQFLTDGIITHIKVETNSPETDPELLAFEIIALASLLQGRYGVRRVFIGQIMPRFEANGSARRLHWIARRPVHYVTQYRACAEATNSVLEKETARYDGITFWRHAKFTMAQDNNCRRRFRSDGVHHSESGLYHFYKSIRGALTGTCLTSPNRH
nr:hypothetical protein BaRGS_020149 [Batillaria attramentaria]